MSIFLKGFVVVTLCTVMIIATGEDITPVMLTLGEFAIVFAVLNIVVVLKVHSEKTAVCLPFQGGYTAVFQWGYQRKKSKCPLTKVLIIDTIAMLCI